jgi:tetratricopeptide (TPR) repeat protein
LLNNLAAVYEQRGQMQESEALLRQIFDKHPDYSFPRINLARMRIRRGELDQAEELLKPLLSRKRFHFNEFGYFCNAQIELFTARKNKDAARSWLGMWEGIDPEHPAVWQWKVKLEGPSVLAELFGRDKPRRRQK